MVTTFVTDKDTADKLAQLAKSSGLSNSKIIRAAITLYYSNHRPDISDSEVGATGIF